MTNYKRIFTKFFFPFLGSLYLLFQFNNCSKYKQPTLASSSSSSNGATSISVTAFPPDEDPLASFVTTGDLCEDDIKKLFLTGYYKLVRVNCSSCHMKDTDKPQFASMDYSWAWQVFKSKGYAKVSEHATSESHKPPATGLHLLPEVTALSTEWKKGLELYNTCKGLPPEGLVTDPNELTTIQTTQKNIPAIDVDKSVDIQWDLTKELEPLKSTTVMPKLGASASFVITVTHRKTTGGDEYYTLKNPRIYNNATGVIVKSMHVKLNTRFVNQQTTFKYLTAEIPQGTKVTDDVSLLATGAMPLLGQPTNTDNLRFAFEVLQDGVVAPPVAPALVKFTSSNVRIIDPNKADQSQYLQNFQVQAGGQVSRPVVISAVDVTENICNQSNSEAQFTVSSTCLPQVYNAMQTYSSATNNAANFKFYTARSVTGSGGYNRFDWDFKFINGSLNLQSQVDGSGNLIPDPKGNITIKFSKDIRKEAGNRLLRIRLSTESANGTTTGTGAVSEVYVVFLKVNNPDPKANYETSFSGLMNPQTGILGTKCIKCHNSVLFNGGYDITDYEQMTYQDPITGKAVLIPFDIMSEMYRRTNAGDDINLGKSPMPANGGLSPEDRALIADWILNGAKNN